MQRNEGKSERILRRTMSFDPSRLIIVKLRQLTQIVTVKILFLR